MIGQLGQLGNLGGGGSSGIITPYQVGNLKFVYDMYRTDCLFQDKNGITPITSYGQPVGLQLDLSQGLALGPEIVTNTGGPFINTTGWASYQSTVTVVNGLLINTKSDVNGRTYILLSSLTVGRLYEVKINFIAKEDITAFKLSETVTALGTTLATVGLNTIKIFATAADMYVTIFNNASVSLVSVREILGNHRFSESAARPTYIQDANGKPCFGYNGVGSFMRTNTFAWGSDEVCVVAGVRKLSDAASGVLLEFSQTIESNDGSFAAFAPITGVKKI